VPAGRRLAFNFSIFRNPLREVYIPAVVD